MQVLQDSFPCINHLPKELQSNFKKQKKFKRKKKKKLCLQNCVHYSGSSKHQKDKARDWEGRAHALKDRQFQHNKQRQLFLPIKRS